MSNNRQAGSLPSQYGIRTLCWSKDFNRTARYILNNCWPIKLSKAGLVVSQSYPWIYKSTGMRRTWWAYCHDMVHHPKPPTSHRYSKAESLASP